MTSNMMQNLMVCQLLKDQMSCVSDKAFELEDKDNSNEMEVTELTNIMNQVAE